MGIMKLFIIIALASSLTVKPKVKPLLDEKEEVKEEPSAPAAIDDKGLTFCNACKWDESLGKCRKYFRQDPNDTVMNGGEVLSSFVCTGHAWHATPICVRK